MEKEEKWMEQRCGRITASELHNITSKSGKIIEGNLSYIRSKRWERKHGWTLPVSARAMDIGNEQEPYIFQWALKNLPERFPVLEGKKFIYSKRLQEIPFWVPEELPCFGGSPDAFTEDESVVFEFKTLVSNSNIEFFMDEHTSYNEKYKVVVDENGDQILGLFISNPKVQSVYLVKYCYQNDDIVQDVDSPLASWRGVVFCFFRDDLIESIQAMKERIALFDSLIDSNINPKDMKNEISS